MEALSTALRLTGRDALGLLHRTTSQALADLARGEARTTLFCDFRGRVEHRALVVRTSDDAVWLLRADAPGAPLAAAVDRSIFRDDVVIEDRSGELAFVCARAPLGVHGVIEERDGVPRVVAVGDGTLLACDGREPLTEADRIAHRLPRAGHEVTPEANPFECGLGAAVHLAKGCFTGQEALQRLVTYASVRRRLARVRLRSAVDALPVEVLQAGEKAGVLTSAAGEEGLALLRHECAQPGLLLQTAAGATLEVVEAPEPARALGRP
jgi:folate-binding protein YgfZ